MAWFNHQLVNITCHLWFFGGCPVSLKFLPITCLNLPEVKNLRPPNGGEVDDDMEGVAVDEAPPMESW